MLYEEKVLSDFLRRGLRRKGTWSGADVELEKQEGGFVSRCDE